MATCPHCESDVTEWVETIQRAPGTNDPQIWTCPECDTILGVSSGQPQ